MEYKIFSHELEENVIMKIFPNIIKNNYNILKDYYANLLEVIYYAFYNQNNSNNLELFKKKLSLDDYSDAKAIFLLLLPYINSGEDTTNINSLEQLFTEKYKSTIITKEAPKYKFSNFQYNRCKVFRDQIE